MNCKEGDLVYHKGAALGVRSRNYGKIFSIVRFIGKGPDVLADDCWEIEGLVFIIPSGRLVNYASDSNLRPLRDQPGTDETMLWAGLPQPIEIDCTTKQGAEHE